MHIEFLIEDNSGKEMLKRLIPKILSAEHSYLIHGYKGVGGKIPAGCKNDPKVAKNRILLDNLPRLLSGYGKTFHSAGKDYQGAVIVICDLDRRDKNSFEAELNNLLQKCTHKPNTKFCLAIEEGEAWFLGDQDAIFKAYPHYKRNIVQKYEQDSICGTWETLADALYPGGHSALSNKGYQAVGKEKEEWAKRITPCMNVDNNKSPSFCHFRNTVRNLTQ